MSVGVTSVGLARSWGPGTRTARGLILLQCATFGAAGCLYEADDRCGPNQSVSEDDVRCVCAEGSAWTARGCVACGENEQASANGCECVMGYLRPTADAACETAPSGLGQDCDSVSTACTDSVYGHCRIESGTAGYCTRLGCTGSEQCEGGYACDTGTTPPFCRRPPVGMGLPCETEADCAGTEATWCDSVMSLKCVVQGCSVAAQDCFGDLQCCDLSQFGVPAPLCLPPGGC
jgi:hypothetical protein